MCAAADYDIDIDALEAAIKEKVTADLAAADLGPQIKQQVETQVRELVNDQYSVEQKYGELLEMEAQLMDEFRKLTLKQKLNMVLEDLSYAQALDELWADSNADPATLQESFENIAMTFDTEFWYVVSVGILFYAIFMFQIVFILFFCVNSQNRQKKRVKSIICYFWRSITIFEKNITLKKTKF